MVPPKAQTNSIMQPAGATLRTARPKSEPGLQPGARRAPLSKRVAGPVNTATLASMADATRLVRYLPDTAPMPRRTNPCARLDKMHTHCKLAPKCHSYDHCARGSCGCRKADTLVAPIEFDVVLAHEDIAKDPMGPIRKREIQALHAKDALVARLFQG